MVRRAPFRKVAKSPSIGRLRTAVTKTSSSAPKKLQELPRPSNSIKNPEANSSRGTSFDSSSKRHSGCNASNNADESIDELFQNFKAEKRKRQDRIESERKLEAAQRRKAREERRRAEKSALAASSLGEPFRLVSPEAPVHRIDEATGLPVYKAHLLKVGEGGGTPLCPFDCNCCF